MTRRDDHVPERSLERARRGHLDDGDRLHRWETLAERRIREAMEEGAFDGLAGRGKPLDLREDPYVDPAVRLGHQLLRNNGYSLPWIESAHELQRARAALVARLHRLTAASTPAVLDAARAEAAALNRRIRDHNLVVPVPGMAVRVVDADAELGGKTP